MIQDKIGRKEKLSYALVNMGNIPIMTLINGYLLIFYTNICGLNPAACATLFLIARILDGLNDPLVGYVIDHLPTTKHGHFRPTLIVGTILCSLNFLLLWFGPMIATSGKMMIAYISYLLIGVMFPIMDISLNSMLPVMTMDMNERNMLSSIKGIAYVIGALVIGIAAPIILGNASNRQGYILLICAFTGITFIFSIFGTLGIKERVKVKREKSYKVKDLVRILTQKPVILTFLTVLLFTIGNNIVSTVNTYFYTYILGNLTISSILTLVMCVTIVPATMLVPKLIQKYGKKKLYIIGLGIVGLTPVLRLIDPRSIPILIITSLITGLGSGIAAPLNYGIQADNTDYVELKLNQRTEGAIASLSSFISKFAMGIGGAIPGYLLEWAGFDKDFTTQTDLVNNTIITCVIIVPAILNVIGLFVFLKYPLGKKELEKQNEDLARLHAREEINE